MLESACLTVSMCLCVCLCVIVSICEQNDSSCQSAGGGIKPHLVTALVDHPLTYNQTTEERSKLKAFADNKINMI